MVVWLSFLMFIKAAGLFIIFIYLINFHFTFLSLPFLYASLVSLLVSLASHPWINLPTILGKNADGSFPVWSLIIFGSYLYFVRFVAALKRWKRKESPYSEVLDGLYIGGWPFSPENLPPGDPAVIDCTCELPRMFSISESGYLCIPTWDTRPPDPIAIESAVQWVCIKSAHNIPVFIHCASGQGRSATVVCALLVAFGMVDDVENAEKLIREKRPTISMRNPLFRRALEIWSTNRLSLLLKPEPVHTLR